MTFDDLITDAYQRCGINPQILTAYHVKQARAALQLCFNEFSNRNVRYWSLQEVILPLTPGQSKYELKEGVLELPENIEGTVGKVIDIKDAVMSRDNLYDQSIIRISLQEWNTIPNKQEKGIPSQFYVDKKAIPEIFLWQVPDSIAYSLRLWVQNYVDVTTIQTIPSAPQYWDDCLCAALTARLSERFAPQIKLEKQEEYERTYNLAEESEDDGAPLQIKIMGHQL